MINVKPLASESESTELQAKDPAGLGKLLSHLDNGGAHKVWTVQAAEVFTGLFVAFVLKAKAILTPKWMTSR